MTRQTNARVAGAAYLCYIAVAFPAMILTGKATAGLDVGAQVASLATHLANVRLASLLSLLGCLAALVLAVTLYAVTREEDHDIALFGMACRVGEGVLGAASVQASSQMLWLASSMDRGAVDAATTNALGGFILHSAEGWGMVIGGTFFAVGSTAFCWLLLRGRLIPVALATLGVAASALLVLALPLQMLGLLSRTVAQLVWLPMAAFEIPAGVWLIAKGVAEPGRA